MMIDLDLLQERAALYRLLVALYEYPLTADLLTAVSQLHTAPDSPLAVGLLPMQTYLAESGDNLETLNVEMTRLLEGPGQPAAPPYASYYLFGGRLMGPPAQAARQAYLAWNVWPGSQIRLPDDHISFELGFLAYLAEQAADAVTESDRAAALLASQTFMQKQVRPWLSRFCAALIEVSDNAFFVGLARLTKTAVAADLEWLSTVHEITTANAVLAGS